MSDSVSVPESFSRAVRIFLAPHEGRLELGELVRLQLLPRQDEADHVLGEESEGAQVENFIAVIVHELQHLLEEELGALVLDVPLCRGQEGADSVHCYTALRDTNIDWRRERHQIKIIEDKEKKRKYKPTV